MDDTVVVVVAVTVEHSLQMMQHLVHFRRDRRPVSSVSVRDDDRVATTEKSVYWQPTIVAVWYAGCYSEVFEMLCHWSPLVRHRTTVDAGWTKQPMDFPDDSADDEVQKP